MAVLEKPWCACWLHQRNCSLVASFCLIFPVRSKLWLNRHPFADIIVYTKGSCWLGYVAREHHCWVVKDCNVDLAYGSFWKSIFCLRVCANVPTSGGGSTLHCPTTGQGISKGNCCSVSWVQLPKHNENMGRLSTPAACWLGMFTKERAGEHFSPVSLECTRPWWQTRSQSSFTTKHLWCQLLRGISLLLS